MHARLSPPPHPCGRRHRRRPVARRRPRWRVGDRDRRCRRRKAGRRRSSLDRCHTHRATALLAHRSGRLPVRPPSLSSYRAVHIQRRGIDPCAIQRAYLPAVHSRRPACDLCRHGALPMCPVSVACRLWSSERRAAPRRAAWSPMRMAMGHRCRSHSRVRRNPGCRTGRGRDALRAAVGVRARLGADLFADVCPPDRRQSPGSFICLARRPVPGPCGCRVFTC
jgi:hypothetical protein